MEARAYLIIDQIAPFISPFSPLSADAVDNICKQSGINASTRITVILRSGKVIGDSDKNPEVMTAIISGDFMSATCPRCGKILKPEYPFKLFSNTQKINLYFIPELDRSPYLLGKLEYDIGTPGRVVIGYRELAEKRSDFEGWGTRA